MPYGYNNSNSVEKKEAMRDEKNDSNCNKVRWYPV